MPSVAAALDVTLEWLPNTEINIAGYRLYYGSESGNYEPPIDVGYQTGYTITGLEDGKSFFYAVTAYTSGGRSSRFSDEVQYPASAPVNLLENGGFESGDLSGWTATSDVDIESFARYTGYYGIKLNKGSSIQQKIKTTKGRNYTASARIRIDDEIKAPTRGGMVLIVRDTKNRTLAKSPYISLRNSYEDRWTSISFPFTATTKKTKLIFKPAGDGKFEASADSFSVKPR